MGNNYTIEEKRLDDLLGGSGRYDIPDYQRSYSWKKENVERLWRDLTRSEKDEYLLGPIVVVKKDSNEHRHYDVVDGQQRIATLTIMLCAIRDYIHENVSISDYRGTKTLLDNINTRIQTEKGLEILRLGETNQPVFEKIQETTNGKKDTEKIKGSLGSSKEIRKSNKLLLDNYDVLYKKMDEYCKNREIDFKNKTDDSIEMLRTELTSVFKNNTFAYVLVHDITYAPQIFEALNTTGQKLTQADMIKNWIINKCDKSNREKYKKKWDEIIRVTENNGEKPDSLIYESLLSRHYDGKVKFGEESIPIQMNRLYKIINKKCQNDASISKYLNELYTDSRCYGWLLDPDDGYSKGKFNKKDGNGRKTKLILEGIDQLGAKYIRVPILAACREWGIDSYRFVMLIDCLVKFFFRFRTISDGSTDTVRTIAREVTRLVISGEQDDNEIIKQILLDRNKARTSMSKFTDDFTRYAADAPTAAVARYILIMIEEKLRSSSDVDAPYENFELEHVLPQKPTEDNWPTELFSKPGNESSMEDAKHRLGNLTLIKKSWNAAMKNRKFVDKKEGKVITKGKVEYIDEKSYKNSDLKINEEHLQYDRWDIKNLEAREDALCKIAGDVWDLGVFFKKIGVSER